MQIEIECDTGNDHGRNINTGEYITPTLHNLIVVIDPQLNLSLEQFIQGIQN